MSQWTKQFSRLGRDGYHLARAVVQNRGGNVKPMLLEHARQANTVANSLLHVDKEVGLVQYYGLSGYLKRRWQSTSATTGDKDKSITAAAPDVPNTAKVAFMVTASMKQELKDRLGYEPDQIKKLTPLQASLILNNSIEFKDFAKKLPLAEQEYETQRTQEEEAHYEHLEMQREEQEQEAAQAMAAKEVITSSSDADRTRTVIADNKAGMITWTPDFVFSGGYASQNVLDQPQASGFGENWFEVVETKNGETSRVGLYLDEDEAQLGMQTREEIAESKNQAVTFELHRIARENL